MSYSIIQLIEGTYQKELIDLKYYHNVSFDFYGGNYLFTDNFGIVFEKPASFHDDFSNVIEQAENELEQCYECNNESFGLENSGDFSGPLCSNCSYDFYRTHNLDYENENEN